MTKRFGFFSCLLLILLGSAVPLWAQPDELVGFRLDQDIHEIQKTYGYRLRQIRKTRTDQALQTCGMESYEMEHEGERLVITSIRGRVAKLDLSRELPVVDPVGMAAKFVAGYGAPRTVWCQLGQAPKEVHALPSECGRKQTYLQMEYWRGEKDTDGQVLLRVRLRGSVPGFTKGSSRITLSRGWDAQVARLAECSHEASEDLKRTVTDAARENIPLGLQSRVRYWWDPWIDAGWLIVWVD